MVSMPKEGEMVSIVINDRSREVPHLMVMRSRITGKLRTYEQSCMKSPGCKPFEQWDMEYVKREMQKQADLKGLDVIVDSARHFRTADADYLETVQWVPVEVTGGEVRLEPVTILMIILVFIKFVLPIICAAIIVYLVGTLWVGPFTKPPEPYKGFYQYDKEGKTVGPMTYTEFYTYKQAEHPDEFPCHYCGTLYDTDAERVEHEETCPWRDKPWTKEIYPPGAAAPEWVPWAIGGGIALLLLLFGIMAISRRK